MCVFRKLHEKIQVCLVMANLGVFSIWESAETSKLSQYYIYFVIFDRLGASCSMNLIQPESCPLFLYSNSFNSLVDHHGQGKKYNDLVPSQHPVNRAGFLVSELQQETP